jgi:hypothetical protein
MLIKENSNNVHVNIDFGTVHTNVQRASFRQTLHYITLHYINGIVGITTHTITVALLSEL